MHRLYLTGELCEKIESNIEISMKDRNFVELVTDLFYEDAFILGEKFSSPARDLKIDFITGDIYIPVSVGSIVKEDKLTVGDKIPNEYDNYINNSYLGLISLTNVRTFNRYFYKSGKLVNPELKVYYSNSRKMVTYNLEGVSFENNLTSEDILDHLMTRELAGNRTRISKVPCIKVSKKFLEVQTLLGNRVFSNNKYRPYQKAVPKVEHHVYRKYREVDIDKNLAEIIFNLCLFCVIKEKNNLILHDRTYLLDNRKTDKFFYKIKNDIYYLVIKEEWFSWQ